MADDTLIGWYEELAEESANEAVEIVKRLLTIAGDKPLAAVASSPFQTWARIEELMGSDDAIAGFAAQFGWQGIQELIRLRNETVTKLGIAPDDSQDLYRS